MGGSKNQLADIQLINFQNIPYKNDALVRDYVAAKRKKDGKVGLFDKVENKFYTSPNGTEFIAG